MQLENQKRSPGRPTKTDALTPAQRAKRYRDTKRLKENSSSIKSDVTENNSLITPESYMRLKRMYWDLEDRVRIAEEERDALVKQNDELRHRLGNT